MGFALHLHTGPSLWSAGFDAVTCVESRSPLPAFKNLGRGVF
jgi:hypothetical protein